MSSAEKKRLRDRRSQQNFRNKKSQHISKLEKQVAHCENNHSDQGVQRLFQVIAGLRRENETLRSRQDGLKYLINSWSAEPDTGTADLSSEDYLSFSKGLSPQFSFQPDFHDSVSSNANALPNTINKLLSASAMTTPPSQAHSPSSELLPPGTTLWNQIPPHSDDLSNPQSIFSCLWFLYPEQITPCPDTLGSPLDILYGTKENALADMIHSALQRRPIRDPERLSIGWLSYHLSRWFLRPSPETYERLPLFLRPVQGQMEVRHPLVLDFLPWPRLRLNLIRRWHFYCSNREDLFGMFACCTKIRWPWGEDILERDDRNELRIKKRFFDTFMSQSGWGLTPEFIRRYPDLVEGMDIREIEFALV
ncbi:uncharacterized protein N7529_004724 [Penicillium soppii]|uniref:uncharacterized protein n=1 Tax=Penicillium soppii TaxID=69789 RepID=UPI00254971EB|nr:uncharacterized protein N7529_004724 [Penicillium soppii]KAJ5872371.1 hypothetical protein N7529_004724 [Penicillium soppii]